MPKSKPKRSGSMGPVFAQFLKTYEDCERTLIKMNAMPDQEAPFPIDVDQCGEIVRKTVGLMCKDGDHSLIERWGNDARQLRSAFKFKMSYADMEVLCDYEDPEIVLQIPFPECVLVVNEVEHQGAEHFVAFLEERVYFEDDPALHNDSWYAERGMRNGDKFLCITAGIKFDKVFSVLPVEYHAELGRTFDDEGSAGEWCPSVPQGTPDETLEMMEGIGWLVMKLVSGWVQSLNNPNHKIEDTSGLKPGVKHRAPRLKERRLYEHNIVKIDPLATRKVTQSTGHGGKHRLHPVRGFWRQYKSGKRVWVRPHWRGDKELGVITHDYEVKHEPEEET